MEGVGSIFFLECVVEGGEAGLAMVGVGIFAGEGFVGFQPWIEWKVKTHCILLTRGFEFWLGFFFFRYFWFWCV